MGTNPPLSLKHIFYPTDFSLAPEISLAHALKLALVTGARLTIFHVNEDLQDSDWLEFPHVRSFLARWGILPQEGSHQTASQIGLHIQIITAYHNDPSAPILRYLERYPADLIVLATHQLGGKPFFQSVAEPIARKAGAMTLFIPPSAPGWVNPEDGSLRLASVLMPIDQTPHPQCAIHMMTGLAQFLGCASLVTTLLHVGGAEGIPDVDLDPQPGWVWETTNRKGNVVQTILDYERELDADLIVMPTQGHQGFLDALRGSTTERIVREAKCPVLAIPSPP